MLKLNRKMNTGLESGKIEWGYSVTAELTAGLFLVLMI